MRCPYCGTFAEDEWAYCGECGVNIKEYEKANEFIERGLELESQFDYAKASEEYKKALELEVPEDKILEHLEKVASKEQAIVDGIEKGEEFFSAGKWRKSIKAYESVIKLNPRLDEGLKAKLIQAKNMLSKDRARVRIWVEIAIIVIVGVYSGRSGLIGWWSYLRTPEQEARHTLKEAVLSGGVGEKCAGIQAMGELKDKRFVPLLKDALKEKHPAIRAAAAKALGEIKDPSTIPILKESLSDENWEVRIGAAQALISLGDSSGIEILRSAVSE